MTGRTGKAKWLEPEELFYLGFHFAEQTHRAKEFGKEVLELVIKRSPKSEFQALRASSAPVSASTSVTMKGAVTLREAPSTHST